MDTEQIKQLATDVNNVALASFQSGKEHIKRPLLAKIKRLENQRAVLLDMLKECKEPILRYRSCLHGYAKESAHKGKRDDQTFWEQRTKEVAKLLISVKQVIAESESERL